MATKKDPGKKTEEKMSVAPAGSVDDAKPGKKPAIVIDDDDDADPDEEVVKPKKAAKGKKSSDDDEEEEEVEIADEWEKSEEDNWDPDFDEFDVPASKTKKAGPGKKAKDEDDALRPDDDFKEFGLFDDEAGGRGRGGYDDDDDY